LPKFFLEKTVKSKREVVFLLLSNFENYQKLIPQHFPSVRIRSVRENTSVVEEHMNFGDLELLIMAKHVIQKPVLHEIFVIGGDVKGSYIKQQFIEIPEGTKVLVDVDLKLNNKLKISNLLGKHNFEEDYLKILDDFAKIAEKSNLI
jgi:coenzyme Q-binding protein COQ10